MSFSVKKFQEENAEWAERNFGDVPPWQPLLGIQEEAGELCHHFLKDAQNIRGSHEEHLEGMKDAVGDIAVYLVHFCTMMGFDAEEVIEKTWNEVKQRDWKKDSGRGVVGTKAIQDRKP
jgi:NTP pyrophosphatase (non-canonical NTP hydrolase)